VRLVETRSRSTVRTSTLKLADAALNASQLSERLDVLGGTETQPHGFAWHIFFAKATWYETHDIRVSYSRRSFRSELAVGHELALMPGLFLRMCLLFNPATL